MSPLEKGINSVLALAFVCAVIGVPAAYYGRASARSAELATLRINSGC